MICTIFVGMMLVRDIEAMKRIAKIFEDPIQNDVVPENKFQAMVHRNGKMQWRNYSDVMDDDLFVNFPDENTLLAEAAKHQLGEVYLHPDYNTKFRRVVVEDYETEMSFWTCPECKHGVCLFKAVTKEKCKGCQKEWPTGTSMYKCNRPEWVSPKYHEGISYKQRVIYCEDCTDGAWRACSDMDEYTKQLFFPRESTILAKAEKLPMGEVFKTKENDCSLWGRTFRKMPFLEVMFKEEWRNYSRPALRFGAIIGDRGISCPMNYDIMEDPKWKAGLLDFPADFQSKLLAEATKRQLGETFIIPGTRTKFRKVRKMIELQVLFQLEWRNYSDVMDDVFFLDFPQKSILAEAEKHPVGRRFQVNGGPTEFRRVKVTTL